MESLPMILKEVQLMPSPERRDLSEVGIMQVKK